MNGKDNSAEAAPKRRKGKQMPLNTPTQIRKVMIKVFRQAHNEEMDTLDASRLVTVLSTIMDALENTELVKRMEQLEALLLRQAEPAAKVDPAAPEVNAPIKDKPEQPGAAKH